jgi:hypothetical protein
MTSSYDSYRNRNPKIRASDGDREEIAEILRDQHAEGRLDTDEMQERIDACYQAKTVGELDQLLEGLPRGGAGAQQARPWSGLPRMRPFRLWPILIALVVLSAITGHAFFWIAIPLFFLATRFFAPRCGRGRRGRNSGAWA